MLPQVRRYREALINAGATGNGGGGRKRGMDLAQLDSLAERMALDHLRSNAEEDPVRFGGNNARVTLPSCCWTVRL